MTTSRGGRGLAPRAPMYAVTCRAVGASVSSMMRPGQCLPLHACALGCGARVRTKRRPEEGRRAMSVDRGAWAQSGHLNELGQAQKYGFRCPYVLWVHACVLDRFMQSPGVLGTRVYRWSGLVTLYSQYVTS